MAVSLSNILPTQEISNPETESQKASPTTKKVVAAAFVLGVISFCAATPRYLSVKQSLFGVACLALIYQAKRLADFVPLEIQAAPKSPVVQVKEQTESYMHNREKYSSSEKLQALEDISLRQRMAAARLNAHK